MWNPAVLWVRSLYETVRSRTTPHNLNGNVDVLLTFDDLKTQLPFTSCSLHTCSFHVSRSPPGVSVILWVCCTHIFECPYIIWYCSSTTATIEVFLHNCSYPQTLTPSDSLQLPLVLRHIQHSSVLELGAIWCKDYPYPWVTIASHWCDWLYAWEPGLAWQCCHDCFNHGMVKVVMWFLVTMPFFVLIHFCTYAAACFYLELLW